MYHLVGAKSSAASGKGENANRGAGLAAAKALMTAPGVVWLTTPTLLDPLSLSLSLSLSRSLSSEMDGPERDS